MSEAAAIVAVAVMESLHVAVAVAVAARGLGHLLVELLEKAVA